MYKIIISLYASSVILIMVNANFEDKIKIDLYINNQPNYNIMESPSKTFREDED